MPLWAAQNCQILNRQLKIPFCLITQAEAVPFLAEVVEPKGQSAKIEFKSESKNDAAFHFDDLISIESSLTATQNRQDFTLTTSFLLFYC